jgi:hypothetical protein
VSKGRNARTEPFEPAKITTSVEIKTGENRHPPLVEEQHFRVVKTAQEYSQEVEKDSTGGAAQTGRFYRPG